jgi:integrase
MFSLVQLAASGRDRQWILMDWKTCLPLLYPLRYCTDHLAFRALSTQSASLQAIKFFYEFWLQKHHVTFCYSFHTSGHDALIAIHEMDSFFHYLENGRTCQSNILTFPLATGTNRITNGVRIHAVIRFISFLINTYISPVYQDGSPKELSRMASRLHTRLLLCKEEYRALSPKKAIGRNDSYHGFQSMTSDMVMSVYKIITPNSIGNTNILNPFPTGNIQLRNFLIVRILLNYGLRISELLLLECNSIKRNIRGDKYSLIITSTDEAEDPRKRAPSLKNIYAHRVLELDLQDYKFLMVYIDKIRPSIKHHNFIFTALQQSDKPLSYNAVHAIFSQIDKTFETAFPEYKSVEHFDAIQRLTPHVTRHTWANLTLHKIYWDKYHKYTQTAQLAEVDFSIHGLMEEAKEELRIIGGWSMKSRMPDLYAKRFLSQQANTANLRRIEQDNSASHVLMNQIMERLNDVTDEQAH